MKVSLRIMLNQLWIITSTTYLRYFLLFLVALFVAFLSGIHCRNFENGYILSIWGRDIPNFESVFFKLYLSFVYFILFIIVFPIGFAHHIHNLTRTEHANIYLSRSITRTNLLTGTLFSFYSFFLILIILLVTILTIYFRIITGAFIPLISVVSLQFIFLFFSSFTLLCSLILITNSTGTGVLLYVVYVFFICGIFMVDKLSPSLTMVQNIFSFILPPISQTLENQERDFSMNMIKSLTSLSLFFIFSILIYQKKEFVN